MSTSPPELKNDRLIRALRRQDVDCTPVWIMRQAGRYLPEYRATRARAGDFLTLCKTPELACEVTLQPLERFDLDAAILFSDILTIPDAMGLGLSLNEGEGPRFARPVRNAADVESLIRPDPESNLRYVMDAVRLIRRELNGRVPLIGFSGSPWTLATYMVEGQSSRDFSIVKNMVYQEPSVARRLLGILSESIALYLRAQAHAGAQVLMMFDTWGGALGHAEYRHFSLDPMAQIVEALRGDPVARALPKSDATHSVATGPPRYGRRGVLCRTGSRCKVTWTRRSSMRLPRKSAQPWAMYWQISDPVQVISSIWAMALRQVLTPITSKFLSTLFTN